MKVILKTERTEITRLPKRGSYDEKTIHGILDEALFCTISYARNEQSFQIPTGFCRLGDKIYIHGSVGSHYLREFAEKAMEVCVSVTLMDGLVLARSAFHHSVNYRSVVIFGTPERLTSKDELYSVLESFTEKMCPGRWKDVRKPTENEWKATMVLAIPIKEASAKIRTGPPIDDEEDYVLDIWAGVEPLTTTHGKAIADPSLKPGVPFPSYLKA